MGLFSGKKRTTITGIHERMTQDENFKYSGQIAVAHWIWENSGRVGVDFGGNDLSDYLIQSSQSALPKRFDKLYRYAKKDGKYDFGVPTSHLTQEPKKHLLQAVQSHLTVLHGGNIQVVHFEIGQRDFYTEAWYRLVQEYGYDSKTNELTVLSKQVGYPCYLYDAYLALSENTQYEYQEIGFENKTLAFNYGKYFQREESILTIQTPFVTATSDHLVLTYGYEMDVLPEIDLDNLNEAQYVEYQKERVQETLQIDLSDINPELQEGDELPKDNDWIYMTYLFDDDYYWFRYEYQSGKIPSIDNALTDTAGFGEYYPRLYVRLDQSEIRLWHKDSKQRKDTIKLFKKLDLDLKEVSDGFYNSVGEEYWNTRGVYIFMGIRINASVHEPVFAEYCFNYFKRLFDMSDKVPVYKNENTTTPTGQVTQIQVLDTSIERSVGGVQTIKDKVSEQTLYYGYIDISTHTGRVTETGSYIAKPRSDNKHYFLYQTKDDEYVQLSVQGVYQSTYISGYSFTKWAGDEDLIIPIDRTIIPHLTGRERELLFHKSLHVAMLHVKVTKTKWYQRGAFKVVLGVIAVAITIATKGAGMSLVQMIKAGAVSALKAVAVSYTVNALVKVAIKLGLDPKIAGVVAFVASIAFTGMANGFDFSRVLTAPNIMKAINQSFKFYEKMLQAQYMDTLNQIKQLQDTIKNKEQLLKETQKLLDTKVFNPTQEMLRSNYTPTVNLFETPDMFYDKHYNFNVVAVSHGLITDFVEGSLNNKQLYLPPQQDVEDVLIIE